MSDYLKRIIDECRDVVPEGTKIRAMMHDAERRVSVGYEFANGYRRGFSVDWTPRASWELAQATREWLESPHGKEKTMTNMAMIEGEKQNKRFLTVPDVARMAHETNRAWCEQRGDRSVLPWEETPMQMKVIANASVQANIDGMRNPRDSHEAWRGEMADAGWVFGEDKNPDASPPTHPCMLEFDDLPVEQQVKYSLQPAIVAALEPFLVRD